MLGVQQGQPSSFCGKSNFPTLDVQGLSSVYLALLVDCKILEFVPCWVYNRDNLLPTSGKSNFPTLDLESLSSVYSALIVEC